MLWKVKIYLFELLRISPHISLLIISVTKSLNDEYSELVVSSSESLPLSSVAEFSILFDFELNEVTAWLSVLFSSIILNGIDVKFRLYHLGLSPIRAGSKTPVCTRKNATLSGQSDHSAKNSTA